MRHSFIHSIQAFIIILSVFITKNQKASQITIYIKFTQLYETINYTLKVIKSRNQKAFQAYSRYSKFHRTRSTSFNLKV